MVKTDKEMDQNKIWKMIFNKLKVNEKLSFVKWYASIKEHTVQYLIVKWHI